MYNSLHGYIHYICCYNLQFAQFLEDNTVFIWLTKEMLDTLIDYQNIFW